MKKLLVGLLSLMFFVNIGTAKNPKDYTFYDDLDPAARKEFAQAWLDAGKAFYDAGKNNKAKASFLFTFYLYPMGSSSEEACGLIKDYFNETFTYDVDELGIRHKLEQEVDRYQEETEQFPHGGRGQSRRSRCQF